MPRKKTTKEFVVDAKLVHGDKYRYDYVQYVNSRTKVQIQCPEHGVFLQKPNNHLSGAGCPRCGALQRVASNTKDKEQFIAEANKKHNNKYCYDSVHYEKGNIKVQIICPAHGEFSQSPDSHLSGTGCPHCYGNAKSNTSEFIEKSKRVHGDKYSYDKVQYVNNATKVLIICPEHGEFLQTPNHHLCGRGCPSCTNKQHKSK